MSYKSCPDWPELMELAPDLQFKHMSVADAQLPFDVLSKVSHQSLGEVEICCDLEHHVYNAAQPIPRSPPPSSERTGSRCTNGPRLGKVALPLTLLELTVTELDVQTSACA